MSTQDIRWQQRLSNYKKALFKLVLAVTEIKGKYKTDLSGTLSEDQFLDDIVVLFVVKNS